MSSNTLTDDHPVESIKKFRFNSPHNRHEIEIAIPEVNWKNVCAFCFCVVCVVQNVTGRHQSFVRVRRMCNSGSQTS